MNKKGKNQYDKKDKNLEDICFGKNAAVSFLEEHPERSLSVYIAENANKSTYNKILALSKSKGIPCHKVPREYLDKQTSYSNHQGVMVKITSLDIFEIGKLYEIVNEHNKGPLLFVVLDRVEDVQNFSSIIRTAEVLGASGVVFPKRRSVLPTGTVLKVSSGAAARLPLIRVNSIFNTLEVIKSKNLWVVGLDMEGESLCSMDLPERLAIVVGGEDRGLTRTVKNSCDELAKIPMSGKTGSLNAAVAASIGIYEWRRSVDKLQQAR